MFKYLIAVIAFTVCFCADSFAIVAQSASKALSYNNVASASGASSVSFSKNLEQKKINDKKETVTITIGNSNSYTKSVSANNNLMISLPKEDYNNEGEIHWKIKYDAKYMVMNSNIVEGDRRNITFSLIKTGSPYIFIDKVDIKGVMKRNLQVKVTITQ